MSSRSINKVILVGNLTKDPEVRYTPTGSAVCSVTIATNRTWVTESGQKKEDTEYHHLVAWQKLAELFGQLLIKGSRVYIEGRISTRRFTNKEGIDTAVTEISVEDMIVLDSKKDRVQEVYHANE